MSISQAQVSWKQKSDIPVPSYFLSSFVIADKAYVGLGSIDFENSIYLSTFFKYDPGSDQWDMLSQFPGGGRYASTAFSINGKGYICFGMDDTHLLKDDVWEYDPGTDTWHLLGTFPGGPRYHAAVFVIGNKAYIEGGSVNEGYNYLNDLWCFDPSDTSWTQMSPMPVDHKAIAVGFSMNNRGYIAAGSYMNTVATNDFYEFNPDSNFWRSMPELCNETTGAVQFTIQNKVFIGTGTNYFETFKSFCVYDTTIGYWYDVVGPPVDFSARYGATSFTINNTGYVVGGRSEFYNYPSYILNDMWAYGNFTAVEVADVGKLLVSPNPCSDHISINIPASTASSAAIAIFNLCGQKIYEKSDHINSGKLEIDLENLPAGAYILNIRTGSNLDFRSPILIKK